MRRHDLTNNNHVKLGDAIAISNLKLSITHYRIEKEKEINWTNHFEDTLEKTCSMFICHLQNNIQPRIHFITATKFMKQMVFGFNRKSFKNSLFTAYLRWWYDNSTSMPLLYVVCYISKFCSNDLLCFAAYAHDSNTNGPIKLFIFFLGCFVLKNFSINKHPESVEEITLYEHDWSLACHCK